MEKRHWWGEQEGAGGTTKGKNIKATPARGGREMDQPGGSFLVGSSGTRDQAHTGKRVDC